MQQWNFENKEIKKNKLPKAKTNQTSKRTKTTQEILQMKHSLIDVKIDLRVSKDLR